MSIFTPLGLLGIVLIFHVKSTDDNVVRKCFYFGIVFGFKNKHYIINQQITIPLPQFFTTYYNRHLILNINI